MTFTEVYLFSRSFFRNTQKTFENTEKKKFGFLMVIKTLKLEGKILFLTYILHLSWRTRDKISWEKNYCAFNSSLDNCVDAADVNSVEMVL